MIRRRSVATIGVLALVIGVLPAPVAARDTPGASMYIVRMTGEPAIAYRGGVAGYPATAPRAGRKLDPTASHVVRYVAHLADRHARALQRVGGASTAYDYGIAFNGFSALLTPGQARRLARSSDVLAVTPDRLMKPATTSTPDFLGLTGDGGAWQQLGGIGNAGEGMVIGIVDSGIWPENPAFAGNASNASGARAAGFGKLRDWHGRCEGGEAFPSTLCNGKVVGARYFYKTWGYLAPPITAKRLIKAFFPYEYLSPRDADGHGSHTASTAAGNSGVPVVVDDQPLGLMSGMAPRARIAVYKVCWGRYEATSGCYQSDSVAAIDAATADGVDAINFSIGGSTTTVADPVDIAFLYAAGAGIAVSASASNSGPDAGTVEHNGPWLMTTGAGTRNGRWNATLTLGNGATYLGAGRGPAVGSAPIVSSGDAALAGADPTKARLCYSAADNGGVAVLDPAKVTGRIVICDRGGQGRPGKSLAVKQAGGVGMILLNTSPSSLNADLHYVPTIHLQDTDAAAVRAYAGVAGATAQLGAGVLDPEAPAPDVVDFSSRGPALSAGSSLLKPDIIAPGVDILAAVSRADGGRDFDLLSGTSMASPHMTGLMTLVKQAHPDWSAAAIKSALMTTATTRRSDGSPIAGGPFDYGAGQVVPTKALDPGLVYDAGWNDWLAFLCAAEPGLLAATTCSSLAGRGLSTTDPSQLNYPSIAVGDLVGVRTVHRVVTSVASTSQTYTATASVPGFVVTVAPSSFTIAPGATEGISLTFTWSGAPFDAFAAGSLSLTSGSYSVQSPIVLRPLALGVPSTLEITTGSSSTTYPVRLGYTGVLQVSPLGLVGSESTSGTLADDPADYFDPNGAGVAAIPVSIPAATTFLRLQLAAGSVSAGSDLDLYLCRVDAVDCAWRPVAYSAGVDSNETIDLRDPEPGAYVLYVHAYEAAKRSTPYRVDRWLLGTAATGGLAVSASAGGGVQGASIPVTASVTGTLARGRYLGAVVYGGEGSMTPRTIVWVDVP